MPLHAPRSVKASKADILTSASASTSGWAALSPSMVSSFNLHNPPMLHRAAALRSADLQQDVHGLVSACDPAALAQRVRDHQAHPLRCSAVSWARLGSSSVSTCMPSACATATARRRRRRSPAREASWPGSWEGALRRRSTVSRLGNEAVMGPSALGLRARSLSLSIACHALHHDQCGAADPCTVSSC